MNLFAKTGANGQGFYFTSMSDYREKLSAIEDILGFPIAVDYVSFVNGTPDQRKDFIDLSRSILDVRYLEKLMAKVGG